MVYQHNYFHIYRVIYGSLRFFYRDLTAPRWPEPH